MNEPYCQVYTIQLGVTGPVAGTIRQVSLDGYFIQPMINRAGDQVVYWGREPGETGFNVWRFDLERKMVGRLTDNGAVNGHPFWTADSQRVVYFSNFGVSTETDWRMSEQFKLGRSPRNIWLMDRDGQNRQQLTTGAFVDERPCISPDGKTVVFVSDRSGHMHLWSVDVASGKLTQLTRHTGLDYRPIFSPTGDRLAFFTTNNPAGARNLCIMNWPNGSLSFPVPRSVFEWVHGPFWLADGQTLIIHAYPLGKPLHCGLWRFRLPDQHLERLIVPGFGDYAHGTIDERKTTLAFDSHDR